MKTINCLYLTNIVMLVIILSLAACGGGGGGNEPTQYAVSTSVGSGGSISPTSITVTEGNTTSFTIIPAVNFAIGEVGGCGGVRIGNTYTTGPITGNCTVSVSFLATLGAVTPFYPLNGANWNDYIKNDGKSIYSATDTRTDGTETGGYGAVIHGGEMRAVVVSGMSSCLGLTAVDVLGAFNWVCDGSANPVRMVSNRLNDNKRLSDLLDFSGAAWRSNWVYVYSNGSIYGKSSSTSWWNNPVIVDNDGSDGSDMVQGDVRIITVNPAATYKIGKDQIALVIAPAVTLTGTANMNEYLIAANNRAYLWIEGAIDATFDNRGISWNYVAFSVLRNIHAANGSYNIYLDHTANNRLTQLSTDGNGYGVYLFYATDNTLEQVTALGGAITGITLDNALNNTLTQINASNNSAGVTLANAAGNVLLQLTATNNASIGIQLASADGNTLSQAISSNNQGPGVFLTAATNNTLTEVLTTNNASAGVYLFTDAADNVLTKVTSSSNSGAGVLLSNTANNILSEITASNNGTFGIQLSDTKINTLTEVVVVNNASGGLYAGTSSDNTFANVTAANNDGQGLNLYFSSNNYFTGKVQVGNNGTDCQVTSGTNPGLNADCTQQGSSDFGLPITGISLDGSFVGKVSIGDTYNISDTNGFATYPADPASFDWVHFDTVYRGWGKDGSAFPATDHQGRWSTGTGRIWDWSLLSSGKVIRGVLEIPKGNDTLTHTWSNLGSITFLRNAIEVQRDGSGNDNGLCESKETCLYAPNYGSYQGHAALISAGPFSDGVLTGITLMKYEINGR